MQQNFDRNFYYMYSNSGCFSEISFSNNLSRFFHEFIHVGIARVQTDNPG